MNSKANVGIGGLAFEEMELEQKPTDLHANLLMKTSLRYGKIATYIVPSSKLDLNIVEINFPSMDAEWTDGQSGQMFGKFKVMKQAAMNEVDCTTEDYSTVNLTGILIFRALSSNKF